jgi:hypothetical protein
MMTTDTQRPRVFAIGVIAEKSEQGIVEEFFELFKTPWEYASSEKSYDVLLITADRSAQIDAPVVFLYGSGIRKIDDRWGIRLTNSRSAALVSWRGRQVPIYGKVSTLDPPPDAVAEIKDADEAVGLRIGNHGRTLYRFGFDLFREVATLLRSGQPVHHATIPTLDIHIELLRHSIVSAGMPLVEIPPLPPGHRFIACLTHDVDFVGIRRHRFDPTMFGFIYRALCGSLVRAMKGSLSWKKVLANWVAVASLPGIYLGIQKDVMIQFDRYAGLERDLPSTFFFIPYKNRPGIDPEGRTAKGRAVKYEIGDIAPEVQKLLARGCEIGLHGIDAWRSIERGADERMQVCRMIDRPDMGVRMHWLFFSENSPDLLERAGFSYDSTAGYNDAVGYRSGTSQAFQLPGTTLYELPLHIMDTALLSAGRMALSETAAFERVKEICSHASDSGGALTVNWHHRSVGPERFWDDLYVNLLGEMEQNGAWFATARQAVSWFDKRRSAVFRRVDRRGTEMRVQLACPSGDETPGLVLRVHTPSSQQADSSVNSGGTGRKDVPVHGDIDTVIPIHA